ncbi:MAG: TldD/PmbA family protein [Acidimicrobiia bacterium]|nr:TldD/PmbA family protein [Acidimicrobiia bacterium]
MLKLFSLFLLVTGGSFAQSPLLGLLSEELHRNFQVLSRKADPPAYYIAYAVTDQETANVSATLGVITGNDRRKMRVLDVTVRVGTPALDNYHTIRGEMGHFTAGIPIALDDSPDAIKLKLWSETDRCYRLAAQRLINIRTNKEVRVADKEDSHDFSREQPEKFAAEAPRLLFDDAAWAARMRKLSAPFAKYPSILNSGLAVTAQREVKYLVNTEGTRVSHGQPFSRVTIQAQAKASDGMDLATFDAFTAADPANLPKDAEIAAAVDKVASDLNQLLDAPLVDPFVGPAILSGRAAGVFFHEIFGHRVEGHRLKDESDGQTFAKSVGSPVLPEFISVTFDPTLRQAAGEDLNGFYAFDDEGVKARRVTLVDGGILKTFLMSRTPVPGFESSNGHGRRQPGAEVVARQSNLLVESTKQVPEARLKEMLLEEIKRQNKPYGFYFQEITGGFTNTGRRGIQAFKVIPLVVYRVYADGKQELVRGADIVGTPLASFNKIIATGQKLEVFNGYCGAESGNVPVSAVSPSILVSELEVQKKESSRDRPPLLSPPVISTGASK